jgi:hypothetical protein
MNSFQVQRWHTLRSISPWPRTQHGRALSPTPPTTSAGRAYGYSSSSVRKHRVFPSATPELLVDQVESRAIGARNGRRPSISDGRVANRCAVIRDTARRTAGFCDDLLVPCSPRHLHCHYLVTICHDCAWRFVTTIAYYQWQTLIS